MAVHESTAEEASRALTSHPDSRPGGLSVLADRVTVRYRVYEDRGRGVPSPTRRRTGPRRQREIEAVRDVSFEAGHGEIVGVVGRNGSGKSTLLQALAGVLPVTSGAVYVSAQPSLLGVGAALNPALSGRRNIAIGGLALGLTRNEVAAIRNDVIEFSGLADFIDVPLRAYSSGMRARLHFSIATVIVPEILLIDEALAVGDEEFKEKSLARIREIQAQAGTIFFVSHNSRETIETCTRALWLEEGGLVDDGDPAAVIRGYAKLRQSRRAAGLPL